MVAVAFAFGVLFHVGSTSQPSNVPVTAAVFDFGDRGVSVLDKEAAYTYASTGITATLTGWTATQDYAAGFVRSEAGSGTILLSQLNANAWYHVAIYQNIYTAHTNMITYENHLIVNSVPWRAGGRMATRGPTFVNITKSTSSGQIDLEFIRSAQNQHVHVSKLAAWRVCNAALTPLLVKGTMGPSANMNRRYNDVSAIPHATRPLLWIFAVQEDGWLKMIGVTICGAAQTAPHRACFVATPGSLTRQSVSDAWDKGYMQVPASSTSDSSYFLASITITVDPVSGSLGQQLPTPPNVPGPTPAPATECFCTHGTPLHGVQCTKPGTEQCAACDDGYTTGLTSLGGICYLEKSACASIPQSVNMGTCYQKLGVVFGASSTVITTAWSDTNTQTWEECKGRSTSEELCAEATVEAGTPVATVSATVGYCGGVEVTNDICSGGELSNEQSTSYERAIQGILGHYVVLCAQGVRYEVNGKRFTKVKKNGLTFECARPPTETADCPGTPCLASLGLLTPAPTPAPTTPPAPTEADATEASGLAFQVVVATLVVFWFT